MNRRKNHPHGSRGCLREKKGSFPNLFSILSKYLEQRLLYTYIYIYQFSRHLKVYCIIYIIYIQVQAVVKNYKCCNVTRKFQFGLFWSVLNLVLESAAVKDSSFSHVFSPHLIKDQLHQEMSCAICCPASSNRLGCDGAIQLTQKNRGPDVFFMTHKKKTRSNNISSSFEKVQILDPQNDFSS